jgi:hypothetical protein
VGPRSTAQLGGVRRSVIGGTVTVCLLTGCWNGGTGRGEQYVIDQGIIQNKLWEVEVSDRHCWGVKVTNLEPDISDCVEGWGERK